MQELFNLIYNWQLLYLYQQPLVYDVATVGNIYAQY